MEIKNIETDEALNSVVHIVLELRTHLMQAEVINLIKEAQFNNGYRLVASYIEDEPVALLGYRIQTDLVHGRHVYIDDLIVLNKYQRKGIGRELLLYSEGIAREMGCKRLRLCTGVENEEARGFYEKMGWDMRAVVYKRKI